MLFSEVVNQAYRNQANESPKLYILASNMQLLTGETPQNPASINYKLN